MQFLFYYRFRVFSLNEKVSGKYWMYVECYVFQLYCKQQFNVNIVYLITIIIILSCRPIITAFYLTLMENRKHLRGMSIFKCHATTLPSSLLVLFNPHYVNLYIIFLFLCSTFFQFLFVTVIDKCIPVINYKQQFGGDYF